MRRVLVVAGLALVVLIALAAIWVYQLATALETERVTEDVHAIFGTGGNVGVLSTADGAVVVDTQLLRIQGERIREAAERLAGGPVRLVINTHYHEDHTHGNPGFPPGTRVVATGWTLECLRATDADYWSGGREATLPNDLVDTEREIAIGGKTIRLLHLGAGHTGGDLVVHFVEDRVVHLGDLLFAGRYPRVDLAGGGSFRAWIETLDAVLALDFDRVIPGHGPVTDRDGVLAFQRFLREVQAAGAAAAAEGLSLDEMLARTQLREDAGYEPGGLPPLVVFGRDDVLRWSWEEATGAVMPGPAPCVPPEKETP
jgi:glyoxylase-like metal-dependent hydrolase (beta-lactamase superfamily II)